jgi:hypothetical protein
VPTALVLGPPQTLSTDPPATAPRSPSPSPGQPPTSSQPLDGTWRTGPISEADVRRTLEDAGLGRWSDPVLARLPERPFVAQMSIRDRRVNLYLVGPDGARHHYDGQESNVVDGQLRISDVWSRVASGFRWSADSRGTGPDAVTTLSLELEATTEQERSGVPGEVWMRVFYTSADFLT